MENCLNEKMALFRFECIQPLTNLKPGQCEAVLKTLVGHHKIGPNSAVYKLSRATLKRWLTQYRQQGIEGLKPKVRKDKGSLKSLGDDLALALLELKKENLSLSVDAIFYLARKNKILAPNQYLSRATVYRLFAKHKLNTKIIPAIDRKRFEASHPLELVQSDVMHGPRISGKKSYLIAFIDDHSRLILWAEFRKSESENDLVAVLCEAIKRRGLPRKIYVDNGPAFRSTRIAYSLAKLDVAYIHAKPYTPEGKGKCERWFRTIRQNFLPQLSLDQRECFDKANASLREWIDHYYHQQKHSSTGQTPMERFVKGIKAIRRAPIDLERAFRHRILRRVSRDNAISLDGKAYQAPPGCIGKRLELFYYPKKMDEIEAFENNQSKGMLKPINLHSNAKVKRVRSQTLEIEMEPNKKNKPISGQIPFTTQEGQ